MSSPTAPNTGQTPPPRASLKKNVGWNFLGVGVYSISMWLLVAVIARSEPAAAGRFGLGMAIVTPVFLFFGLNLRLLQAVDEDDHNWWNYVAIRALAGPLALLTSVLVGTVWGPRDATYLILAFGMARWVEMWSFMSQGVLLSKRQLRPLGIGVAGRGVMGAIAGVAAWELTGSVTLVGFALAGSWSVVVMFFEIPQARSFVATSGSFTAKGSAELIRRAAPLGLDGAANSLMQHAPRLLISSILGTASLGLFLPVVQLAQYGTVVAGSVGSVFLSQLATFWRDDNVDAFRSLLGKVGRLGSLGAIVFATTSALAGPLVVRLLLGEAFVDTALIVVSGVLVGVISVQRLLARGLQAVGRFSYVLAIDLTMIAVTITIGLWTVPQWGNTGAAVAMLCGFGAGLALVLGALLALNAEVERPVNS